MNTFSADYISNTTTGMTSPNIRGIPRQVEIPIVVPKNKKPIDTKILKGIKTNLNKLIDKLSETA